MTIGRTSMWRVLEKPGYEVERTPGAWVVWGPCECGGEYQDEESRDCPWCGGTNSKIMATCMVNADLSPTDPDMVTRVLGIDSWTPQKIQ